MSILSRNAFEERVTAGAVARPATLPVEGQHALAMAMLREGVISAHDMVQALAQVKAGG